MQVLNNYRFNLSAEMKLHVNVCLTQTLTWQEL